MVNFADAEMDDGSAVRVINLRKRDKESKKLRQLKLQRQ
jgi:hypothetical protein